MPAAPRSTSARLAESVDAAPSTLRTALHRLVAAGPVTGPAGSPTRYTAAPPEVAVEAPAPGASKNSTNYVSWCGSWRSRTPTSGRPSPARGHLPAEDWGMVELVEGQEALRHRAEQLQLGARQEVLAIDCPPYFDSPTDNPIEFQLLARGVECRVLYDAPGLESPDKREFVLRTMTRRIAQLMGELNAQTRFQAGLQAAKRGWL